MSRIFFSHSSKDNFEAVALHGWMSQEGWDDVFFDLDPRDGIEAGQRWERRLHEAASRCEAVVFIVSGNWLASEWCLREYTVARGLNKKLFAALVDPSKSIADLPAALTDTWQVVDLAGGQDMQLFRAVLPGSDQEKHVGLSKSGLTRLKRGLRKAGLDSRFFAWPPANEPGRPPYRGLKPLEAEDAGIFFGRDAPLVDALDRLRGLRAGAPPRLMVILGASGAGKSSFVRAGLLPRLARDDAHFVALSPIRPERAAITGENGFLRALEAACPDRTRAALRDLVRQGAAGVRPVFQALAKQAFERTLADEGTARAPTIVVTIDQAEELFRGDGGDEAQALLALIADLAREDETCAVLVVFAIRSDSYDALEHCKPLEGLRQEALPLLPMPQGAYKEVVEGPARRVSEAGPRLAFEPRLTQKLLEDIERGGGSDSLPLLAFSLEQLYLEYHRAGTIGLADYQAIGGLKGAIDAAVERAFVRADSDPRLPRDRGARETLLRRGLIPWLAGIDPDTKSPRRNIALLSEIPAEAAPLIQLLVEERLLSTDTTTVADAEGREAKVTTIEPTHEALLRQWGLLEGWLAEDLGLLSALEAVKRAARDWAANGRKDAWLVHLGQRLADAQDLDMRQDIAAKLDPGDRAYMSACAAREKATQDELAERRREREAEQERRIADAQSLAVQTCRVAQRTMAGLAAALALALLAGGFGLFARHQKSVAEEQTREAGRQRDAAARAAKSAEQGASLLAASVALTDLKQGLFSEAGLLVLRAAKAFPAQETPDPLLIADSQVLDRLERVEEQAIAPDSRVVDTPRAIFIANDKTKDFWVVDANGLSKLLDGASQSSPVWTAARLGDGRTIVVFRDGRVGSICKGCKAAKIEATFAGLGPFKLSEKPFDQQPPVISDDLLVIRRAALADAGQASGAKPLPYVYDIVDLAAHEQTRVPSDLYNVKSLTGPDGKRHFTDDYEIYDLRRDKAPTFVKVGPADDDAKLDIRGADCLAKFIPKARPAVLSLLKEGDFGSRFVCAKFGAYGIVTLFKTSSSGDYRYDTFVDETNLSEKPREINEFATVKSESANNIESVAVNPSTGAIASARDKNLYFYDAHADGVQTITTSYLISGVHFLADGRVATVGDNSGLVDIFDVGRKSTSVHTVIDEEDKQAPKVEPYRVGGCFTDLSVVDYAVTAKDTTWTLAFADKEKREKLQLSASKGAASTPRDVVDLGADCAQLSRDASHLLTRSGKRLSLYGPVVSPHMLGPRIDLPMDGSDFNSVFLDDDLSIVTTDYTAYVLRWNRTPTGGWTSQRIYTGNYPITYAEPSPDGKRLIIQEYVGIGGHEGRLISLPSSQVWLELGGDYKWLRTFFTVTGEIAVKKHEALTDIFRILPTQTYLSGIKAHLSSRCRYASDNPADSPCWSTSKPN